MAVEQGGKDVTRRAAGDYSSTGQFKLVTMDANGRAALAADGEQCIGVSQNKPGAVDRAMTVRIDGESKLWVKGTVNEGDRLQAITGGYGSVAGTANGTEYGAVAMEAAAAGTAGLIIQVQLAPNALNVTA